jgi:molybdopterin/thiamine biosynthesis adenylyltransferase
VDNLKEFILSHAQGDTITFQAQSEAARHFKLSFCVVEEAILELALMPLRYQQNREVISVTEQLILFRSCVAVVGCGGLGGYVIEELARLGIGRIVGIDPDVFEEHNLNRQSLSTVSLLGNPKAEAASARVREINPAVTFTAYKDFLTEKSGSDMLKGSDLVIDALDTIPARLLLADLCSATRIPLVHGSIGGWYGEIAVQLPGEETVRKIFSACPAERGAEKELGTPSFTAAVIASLQAAEACKVLLNKDTVLKGKMLSVDLLNMDFTVIAL